MVASSSKLIISPAVVVVAIDHCWFARR